MKNLKFLVLLFIATSVGFTSCKKDDGEDDAKANIIGKWSLTKEVWKQYLNGQVVDEGSSNSNTNEWVIEFKSDGTYQGYDEGDLDEEGTYSIQNDGKKLVLNSKHDDEDEAVTINSLNSTEMVLYFEDTETTGNQTLKYTTEETYKKQ
ncbi:MAG: lipocalin family protein [Sphingobacteriaceae bacterium]